MPKLKTEYFDKALEDAVDITTEAINTDKGLYRAARSLYEPGRFRERDKVLDTLFEAYPGCDATKKELHRIRDRLREEDHGISISWRCSRPPQREILPISRSRHCGAGDNQNDRVSGPCPVHHLRRGFW